MDEDSYIARKNPQRRYDMMQHNGDRKTANQTHPRAATLYLDIPLHTCFNVRSETDGSWKRQVEKRTPVELS